VGDERWTITTCKHLREPMVNAGCPCADCTTVEVVPASRLSLEVEARERAERENAELRGLVERFAPHKHDVGCPMHVMHDDVYENPEPDDHPPYPRSCDCGFEAARRALASKPMTEETKDG
jgi:hypothetical protein